MAQQNKSETVPGTVVEFFEAKEILCGVCTAVKGTRLAVLTEQNREINLAQSRVIHFSPSQLDVEKTSRDGLVEALQKITARRRALMDRIRLEEIWSLLEGEEEGFDIQVLAELVFNEPISPDHLAAVQRVLLQDRLYFQFKDGLFYARSEEKVEQRRQEMERAAEREAQLEAGSQWLQAVWQRKAGMSPPECGEKVIEFLRSYCLFGNEAPESSFAKELLKRAGLAPLPLTAFRVLVRLGIWHENENLFLHQHEISVDFPQEVLDVAEKRIGEFKGAGGAMPDESREDLRHLHLITIDGAQTRDYDDALSLRFLEDGLIEVGVHIADAAEFVRKGDPLDEEAKSRVSTLYLPDGRVPMIPPGLSEDICSLVAGKDRLAVSFFLYMDEEAKVHDTRIAPSVVRVREQLTYDQVNARIENEDDGSSPPFYSSLYNLCLKLKKGRLESGAVILPLPEIQVYVNSAGMVQISCHEKESPSQVMVSELMIAANGLAASYLAERCIPAIFRCQAECKPENEPIASEYELFHVYRQRRLFARAELDTEPRMHCSLGMPSYVSVSSPIRRYVDLVVQRQLKEALQTGRSCYTDEELRQTAAQMEAFQGKLNFIHRKWTRYWILKYLEQEDVQKLDALVLARNERFVHLLLPDFLIEANMPQPEKGEVRPGEMVRVRVEKVNPREDVLKMHL